MNNEKTYMECADNAILHIYNRFPIVLERGEGMYLYDVEGRKYLDFASGIGVQSLGYGNKEYTNVLQEQAEKLLHTSNLFYSVPAARAAEKIIEASGMDKVFFTNSGTEAVEGAIKTARKYAYTKDGSTDHEIIAMHHSFHGRSMGALSVTGNEHYQTPFRPLIGGIRFADFNNIDSVKGQITEKTCAIIMETVQGEGGIYPADPDFLHQVKALCEEKDILLILDEIQCGMGRCGTMFAWQSYGVEPDIMTCAKALGCGVPVGAFVVNKKVAEKSLVPGDHGTTYGGNPFVCAAIAKVFELFEKEKILDNVNEVGSYLEECLENIVAEYPFVVGQRGKGLMRGLVLDEKIPVGDVVNKCLKAGLIVITAGGNVLRMLPPLIAKKEHVDEMIGILRKCFG